MVPTDFPDRPRFGREGRAWFYRRVRAWATTLLSRAGSTPELCDQLSGAVAAWFTGHCEEYIVWRDDDVFLGPRYASGAWLIQWLKVEKDFPRVSRAIVGAPDPAASAPVPPGPIDVEAALAALATPGARGAAEPRAIDLLQRIDDRDACKRLWRAVDRTRRKRPRTCQVCDREFVGRQVHAITCDEYKAAGKKRCVACEQVFTTENPKARRCQKCVAEGRLSARVGRGYS